MTWLFALEDKDQASQFHAAVDPAGATYNIPAIELDKSTSKSAVATVFEKVNTGGLPLNVFELLTATFAGDKDYFDEHGTDFRLNDDWNETQRKFSPLSGAGGPGEHRLPPGRHAARHTEAQPADTRPSAGGVSQARGRSQARRSDYLSG